MSSIAIRGHAVLTHASTRYPWSSSGATRSMRNRFACLPCFSARAFKSVAISIRACPIFFETMIPKTLASWARTIAAWRCRSTRSRTSFRSLAVPRSGSAMITGEDAGVPEMGHRRVAEVDDEVHGHVRHVARAERGVRRDEARDVCLRFDLLRQLHGLRAQTDWELQTDRLRVSSSNDFEESVRFAHGSGQTRGRAEKDVPRRLAFFFAFDLEPPRRRKFHAALPEGLLRVVHMILGRRDREDLRARLHPCGRADGGTERGAHALGDAVRAGPRGDFVLAEHIVRFRAGLEMVRVPRLLRDVSVRRDPGRLEGDVANLARLRGDEMDLHRELRPRVPDVELTDPDSGDAAHVPLLGVRLAADLSVHAARLARHRRRALERSGAI